MGDFDSSEDDSDNEEEEEPEEEPTFRWAPVELNDPPPEKAKTSSVHLSATAFRAALPVEITDHIVFEAFC